MFNTKKSDSGIKADQSFGKMNMVGNGTSLSGEIVTDGDIRIDGLLKGSLESAAKVVLGESGRIEGTVYCQNLEIYGEVEGNIFVTELTHLKSSAKIKGDIVTRKLVVEDGAEFNGSCQMGENNLKLSPAEMDDTNGESTKKLFKKKEALL